MLTERQAKIFLMLTRADEKCVSEEKLQDEFSVGGKSISNDINAICREDFGGRIYHKNGSYYLEIADTERKNEFVQRIISEANHDYYSDPAFRTKVILSTLLKARDYVRSAQLQDALFVSKSTLTNDLSRARKTLALYGLGLEIKPHHGLKITGSSFKGKLTATASGMYVGGLVGNLGNSANSGGYTGGCSVSICGDTHSGPGNNTGMDTAREHEPLHEWRQSQTQRQDMGIGYRQQCMGAWGLRLDRNRIRGAIWRQSRL